MSQALRKHGTCESRRSEGILEQKVRWPSTCRENRVGRNAQNLSLETGRHLLPGFPSPICLSRWLEFPISIVLLNFHSLEQPLAPVFSFSTWPMSSSLIQQWYLLQKAFPVSSLPNSIFPRMIWKTINEHLLIKFSPLVSRGSIQSLIQIIHPFSRHLLGSYKASGIVLGMKRWKRES